MLRRLGGGYVVVACNMIHVFWNGYIYLYNSVHECDVVHYTAAVPGDSCQTHQSTIRGVGRGRKFRGSNHNNNNATRMMDGRRGKKCIYIYIWIYITNSNKTLYIYYRLPVIIPFLRLTWYENDDRINRQLRSAGDYLSYRYMTYHS